MKTPVTVALLLTAALILGVGMIAVGCEDLGGTPETGAAASSTVTSEPTATSSAPTPKTTNTTAQPTTTEPPTLVTNTYQENDPHLKWTGPWTHTGGADDSGGSCVYTEDLAGTVTVKFSGISFAIITRTGLAVGKIKVTLDSGSPVLVDCYSAEPAYQQNVWAVDFLPEGTHYVTLECAGSANPASGGTGIYLDAFAITGTLLEQ